MVRTCLIQTLILRITLIEKLEASGIYLIIWVYLLHMFYKVLEIVLEQII